MDRQRSLPKIRIYHPLKSPRVINSVDWPSYKDKGWQLTPIRKLEPKPDSIKVEPEPTIEQPKKKSPKFQIGPRGKPPDFITQPKKKKLFGGKDG